MPSNMIKSIGICVICASFAGSTTAMGDSFKRVETMAVDEMDEESREFLNQMRRILTRVLKNYEEARESRDVVKLNCVNEKLIAVKGLLKISEQSSMLFQELVSQRSISSARHEFGKILMAHKKCAELAAESETCIGEFAVYSGDTNIDIEIDSEQIGDERFALDESFESMMSIPPTPEIVIPPTASPYY